MPEGEGLYSMRCEYAHAKQKGCKARIHIKVLGEEENGEKEAKVIKKVEEMKDHIKHICGEPNASRFHVMKVSLFCMVFHLN